MKHIFRKITEIIHNTLLLLKYGGIVVCVKQLLRFIYSTETQLGFALDLQEITPSSIEARIPYDLRLATDKDMDEVLQKAETEDKQSAQKLIFRNWLYKDGYRNCYVARSVDTGELGFIQTVIHPEENRNVGGTFRSWFPELKEDEILLEGAYTFEKYRGNRLHPAVLSDILRIYKEKGYNRMIAHIDKNNSSAIKGAERVGFKVFQEVPGRKILFFTQRKFS